MKFTMSDASKKNIAPTKLFLQIVPMKKSGQNYRKVSFEKFYFQKVSSP